MVLTGLISTYLSISLFSTTTLALNFICSPGAWVGTNSSILSRSISLQFPQCYKTLIDCHKRTFLCHQWMELDLVYNAWFLADGIIIITTTITTITMEWQHALSSICLYQLCQQPQRDSVTESRLPCLYVTDCHTNRVSRQREKMASEIGFAGLGRWIW